MYSLCFLFFTVPLYFSHVFAPFGLIIGENYSFERQKTYLFLLLLVISYFELLVRFPKMVGAGIRKYSAIIGILLITPMVSVWYFGNSFDMNWLFGSYEKYHGYLFYCGIIALSFILVISPITHLKKYLQWSLASAIIVAFMAIGEYMGGMMDIYGRSQMVSLYPGRSSSTLGNPNYVAGYLLPFVPILIQNIPRFGLKLKNSTSMLGPFLLVGVIVVGIYTTGSYIAMSLLGILFLWYLMGWLFPYNMRKQGTYFGILAIIIMTILLLFLFDPAKILSLQSRIVLIFYTLHALYMEPISLVIGFGSDSIMFYFLHMRNSVINSYFPQTMLIDSSHNLLVDIIFQYGLFPIGVIVTFLYREYISFLSSIGCAVLLVFIFLLGNVFVISHLIILILLVVYLQKVEQSKKTSR